MHIKKIEPSQFRTAIEETSSNKKSSLIGIQKKILALLKFAKKVRFTSVVRLNNQELLTKRDELIDIYNSTLSISAIKKKTKEGKKTLKKDPRSHKISAEYTTVESQINRIVFKARKITSSFVK